ncbi:TPA: UDP-galactopyranose mutase, partial [Raoultella ornithinolytica]|nr:UDP-galactopyranose mutase [Raoultella ornithinolytica]
ASELPAFIINRLPVRFTFDNNYFSDRYQGIPIGGYTKLIQNMLDGIEVRLNTNYFDNQSYFNSIANKVIYTGPIDQYFDYCYGALDYRSLRFEHEILESDNYQGVAVVNYTEFDVPYTRIIEHKHFDAVDTHHSVITKEYPVEWTLGAEAYYPINDEKNMTIFKKYRELARNEKDIIFGGRLAEYKYYDMHQVIASAIKTVSSL